VRCGGIGVGGPGVACGDPHCQKKCWTQIRRRDAVQGNPSSTSLSLHVPNAGNLAAIIWTWASHGKHSRSWVCVLQDGSLLVPRACTEMGRYVYHYHALKMPAQSVDHPCTCCSEDTGNAKKWALEKVQGCTVNSHACDNDWLQSPEWGLNQLHHFHQLNKQHLPIADDGGTKIYRRHMGRGVVSRSLQHHVT
jgi:hypothetical protein